MSVTIPKSLSVFEKHLQCLNKQAKQWLYFLCLENDVPKGTRRNKKSLSLRAGVVYVGQTRGLCWGSRVQNHVRGDFAPGEGKIFDYCLVLPVPNEMDLNELEDAFIRVLRPVFNKTLRGKPATAIHEAKIYQLFGSCEQLALGETKGRP